MHRAVRRTLAAASALVAVVSLASPASADETNGAAKERRASSPERDNPADGLVIDASVGYGAGVLSAIAGQDPKVLYGLAMHVGAGWAFPVSTSKSLAVGGFFEGMFDRASISQDGTSLAPRAGVYGALYGSNAHIRVGVGYASTKFAGDDHTGVGFSFAVGWHFPLTSDTAGHRPAITLDFVPTWDILGANGEHLHRWGMAIMLGASLL